MFKKVVYSTTTIKVVFNRVKEKRKFDSTKENVRTTP